MVVYVSIGNRNDSLSQYRWASYIAAVAEMLNLAGANFHGEFFSAPVSMWQNACWCVEIQPGIADRLKLELAVIARDYEQDSIVWAEVPKTVFLS